MHLGKRHNLLNLCVVVKMNNFTGASLLLNSKRVTVLHQDLLRMIADLFMTVRGFSYASTWIERYKQAQKKIPQRVS